VPSQIRDRKPSDGTSATQEEIDCAMAIGNAVSARIDLPKLNALAQQAMRAKGKTIKITLLRELAGVLGKAAAGIVPCKANCAHCCKQPVLIALPEAEVMARELGIKMTMPTTFGHEGNPAYIGAACSFLDGDTCTIYDHRPFACRVYYAAGKDASNCEIIRGAPAGNLLSIDVLKYHMVYAYSLGDNPATIKYADLREFFPTGLKK